MSREHPDEGAVPPDVAPGTPVQLEYLPERDRVASSALRGESTVLVVSTLLAAPVGVFGLYLWLRILLEPRAVGGGRGLFAGLLVCATWIVCVCVTSRGALQDLRQQRIAFSQACDGCGYDLRASGERCPECGRPIPLRTPRGRLRV